MNHGPLNHVVADTIYGPVRGSDDGIAASW